MPHRRKRNSPVTGGKAIDFSHEWKEKRTRFVKRSLHSMKPRRRAAKQTEPKSVVIGVLRLDPDPTPQRSGLSVHPVSGSSNSLPASHQNIQAQLRGSATKATRGEDQSGTCLVASPASQKSETGLERA